MNKKSIVVTLFLVFIIILSVFVVLQPSNPATEKVSSPFYVGIEFGYGGMSECKELIDKVCNYTNLLVISTSRITGNLTLLNETCDYAYQHSMNIVVYFSSMTYLQGGLTPFDWAKLASEAYGSKFLGCYIYDEPGGEVLDHALDAVGIQQSGGKDSMRLNVLDYHTAATNFVWNLNNSISHYLNASVSGENHFSVITADYGLFWFDYKAGFDTVLTEFGWGSNRELAIALCRGAATAQNKDWGTIICWEEATTGVGWLESGPAMYTDLKLAYDSGATYTVIFNYAGRNATAKQDYANPYPYGIMTDEHFEALQDFWAYIQQNPQRHGIIRADTALVLPEWYGSGFRGSSLRYGTDSEERIWGFDDTSDLSCHIWEITDQLLSENDNTVDIVYDDPEFSTAISANYKNLVHWQDNLETNNYPVINLNNTLGYSSIQQAINCRDTNVGDTIYVKAGIYQENIFIQKAVTLLGENKLTTIIDGGNNGSTVRIGVPNVAVQNFTITNGNGNASFLQTGNTSYVLKPLLEQLGDAFIFFSAYDPAYVANLLLSYAPNSEVMPAPVIASGVYLLNADNCSLIDNIISNCTYGIILSNATSPLNNQPTNANTVMHGNSLINNKYSFGFTSVGYAQTVKDIDNSNIIDGKPICYWINKTGLTVPPDAGYVALINCTNITVENLHLSNNYNNLLIANSHNCKIRNNTLTDNYIGITLIDSVDNVFQDNNIYGNVLNFGNAQFSQNIDTSNLVEGKPVYVWVNEHDKEVPTDAGLVALINCSRITVQNLNLSNNAVGIVLENSNNCTITNNSLTGVNEAIKLTASYDVTISNNTITTSANGITVEADSINNRVLGNSVADSGDSGIKIYASTNNLVYGNHINDCTSGVQINNASYNKVQRNVLTNNTYGISLSCISDGIHLSDSSTFNVIYENNLTDNENGIGILAYEVTNNTVYHNNFKDNTNQAYATAYNTQVRNIWDNGSEGNYWSNYNGTDTNNDGIGDEPLIIFQYQIIIVQEGYDQDHYPLMQPYTKP